MPSCRHDFRISTAAHKSLEALSHVYPGNDNASREDTTHRAAKCSSARRDEPAFPWDGIWKISKNGHLLPKFAAYEAETMSCLNSV